MKNREEKITIRVSQEEQEILREKAKIYDGNVSKFVRACMEGVLRENTIPKTKVLWFLQKILSDPELKKSKKLQQYCKEVFEWL